MSPYALSYIRSRTNFNADQAIVVVFHENMIIYTNHAPLQTTSDVDWQLKVRLNYTCAYIPYQCRPSLPS